MSLIFDTTNCILTNRGYLPITEIQHITKVLGYNLEKGQIEQYNVHGYEVYASTNPYWSIKTKFLCHDLKLSSNTKLLMEIDGNEYIASPREFTKTDKLFRIVDLPGHCFTGQQFKNIEEIICLERSRKTLSLQKQLTPEGYAFTQLKNYNLLHKSFFGGLFKTTTTKSDEFLQCIKKYSQEINQIFYLKVHDLPSALNFSSLLGRSSVAAKILGNITAYRLSYSLTKCEKIAGKFIEPIRNIKYITDNQTESPYLEITVYTEAPILIVNSFGVKNERSSLD